MQISIKCIYFICIKLFHLFCSFLVFIFCYVFVILSILHILIPPFFSNLFFLCIFLFFCVFDQFLCVFFSLFLHCDFFAFSSLQQNIILLDHYYYWSWTVSFFWFDDIFIFPFLLWFFSYFICVKCIWFVIFVIF